MPTLSEVLAVAVKHHQAGRRQEAQRLYRQVLRVDPDHPDALHLLGVIGNETGDQDMAVENIGRAIALRPDIAEFHNNMGNALQAQGKAQLAVDHFRRALRLMPRYATAHNNLGNALKALGDLDGAVASYQTALRLNPNYATALCNMGSVLQAQGKLSEAVATYRRALALKPDFVEVFNNLGNALHAQGHDAEAENAIRQAIRLRPNYPEALSNLAGVLQGQGKLEEAQQVYQHALGLAPTYGDAHANLGTVYLQQGNLADAAACFHKTLEINPGHVLAIYELANLVNRGHASDPGLVGRARQRLSDNKLSMDEAAMLHFVLAAASEKEAAYDEAFEHYQQGSELRRRSLKVRNIEVDHEKYLGLIDRMIETFDIAYFQRVDGFGLDSPLPVFIVGMPRSGTTLTEQILASHPLVYGAGELKQIGRIVAGLKDQTASSEPYPRCVADLDRQITGRIAGEHLALLRRLGGDAERVVDKMPLNYNHLGVIATLFPAARVVHVRRDPLDTCVSCLRQYAIPSSLEEIAVCYSQYEKLMNHWHRVLPIPMLEIEYEQLVTNTESVVRGLIEFCDLAWSDRCLAFHQSDRAVQTPSKLDVRKPMYASSVGRWKRYEKQLRAKIEGFGSLAGQTPG